ncbi:transglycosylase domain-containing protein [Lutibaculum baratangense]|uniref:Multimodular transpeptidase-transglycosylase n=1 Tax=Lutibaculum baratangense AMV1 TaxID=631454 RepID=V4RHM9_9HYPH|nr:penicillin-binding protein 1A [Lutibaculum baratangense]ESR22775.1 Multimodular transpeptidase-transglycosylase [Lutibaculum baratangense AMV1]
MRDLFRSIAGSRRWTRLKENLLAFDSWLDSFFYGVLESGRRSVEGYSARLERLKVKGPARAVTELASDAMTVGAGGAVLMLALALPAFDETSTDWRSTQEYSVTFLDRYGNEIGRRGVLHNATVPLEEIPDHMIKATLATEDRRFYEHFGIDVLGTARALIENMRANGVVQGGSSITQQLAKNLFLSNERTIERKIKEAFLAVWLEVNLTKNEILKLYLDRAYMGGGTFGADAAAEFYFGKSVRDINLAEAAMLAGLFKAPGRYAPHIDLPAARARANEVLQNLVQAGFMTEGQVYAARRNPATPIERGGNTAPDYFLDWAFEEAKRLSRGRSFTLTAKTTLDPALQRAAEEAVTDNLRQHGERYDAQQAALVSMEPDGMVRALVGGRDYGESQFNRATAALRQPGSSFKAYVYAAALMNGYTADSVVLDGPITIGNWSPRNYGRSYRGNVTLMTALTLSINTVPVRLAQKIGRDTIVETAEKMGVRTPLRISRALELGVSEVTVLDQASGYASMANGGFHVDPYGITELRNGEGTVIYRHDRDEKKPEQVLPPPAVADMNRMLHNVVENGTGRRALLNGIPAAGKTGTSQSYRDAWFIGFTGNYVTAVWMGKDNFTSTNRMTGGSLPAMVWQQYMTYAHQGIELKPIPGLDGPIGQTPPAVADAELGAERRDGLTLSRQSQSLLFEIERMMREAAPVAMPESLSSASLEADAEEERTARYEAQALPSER